MGSHGPGSLEDVAGTVVGQAMIVDEGVRGVLGSAVVFVVVRVVTPADAASMLSILEHSGVGEVGEAGQLVDPPSVEMECECEWPLPSPVGAFSLTKTLERRDL